MFLRSIAVLFFILFSFLTVGNFQGCGKKSCKTSLDCSEGEICDKQGKSQGFCVPKKVSPKIDAGTEASLLPDMLQSKDSSSGEPEPSSTPDLIHRDNSPIESPTTQELPPEKPNLPKPQKGDLVINEILYNPPPAPQGDANKDGLRDTYQDEFIELVNVSDKTLDLEGVQLTDDGTKIYFTFPKKISLAPKQAAVIFGGGMSQDSNVNTGQPHPKFGDSLVFTAKFGGGGSRLSLTNSAKTILLKNANGDELDRFAYGTSNCPGNKTTSVTRYPDMTGQCALHNKVSPSGAPFSPGTRVEGGRFSEAAPEPPPAELPSEKISDGGPLEGSFPEIPTEKTKETTPDLGNSRLPKVGELVINELHTDPDSKKGDANRDGKISYSSDEFVEIVNVSNDALRLQGLKLISSQKTVFTFKKPFVLPPHKVVLIFGGGSDPLFNTAKPHPKFAGAYVFTSRLSLTNYGKSKKGSNTVELQDAQGMRVSFFTYGTNNCWGDQNTSLTKSPDLTGSCALHNKIAPSGSLFSPGTKIDGSSF